MCTGFAAAYHGLAIGVFEKMKFCLTDNLGKFIMSGTPEERQIQKQFKHARHYTKAF